MRDAIPAEVLAEPGREGRAAKSLRWLGFRVLHVGATISVSGSRELWLRVFGISFTDADEGASPGQEAGFPKPWPEEPEIPSELKGIVNGVYFTEPPEFF
ncbi:hypothetical protein [Halostreptopolyspora alba]|uniref:Uncharacterized protein n=1 Tax=Halostreptopolyspora alba TaxID=2487137 RepID=A0A3N0E9R7_9ACTN|nr:hypothetical protein EFW17_11700 [Nocardiopsaceae bacterium YIM 96095]